MHEIAHAGGLEPLGQPFLQRNPLLALHTDMEIIHPGDRDHVDAAFQQLADDLFGEQVTRGLYDETDAALRLVLVPDHFQRGIKNILPHGIDQHFPAGDDDPAVPLDITAGGVVVRLLQIEIGEPFGQVRDDAGEILFCRTDDRFQLVADIGPELVLVAMLAPPVTSP